MLSDLLIQFVHRSCVPGDVAGVPGHVAGVPCDVAGVPGHVGGVMLLVSSVQ